MGTNYYLRSIHEDEGDPPVHIGKSSLGWQFSFHGYHPKDILPYSGMESYADWKQCLDIVVLNGWGHIEDEYGKRVSLEEFKAMVKYKQELPGNKNHATYSLQFPEWHDDNWLDPEGYSFSAGDWS